MQLLYSVRGAVWIIVYLLFILAPLFALLAGSHPPARDFWTEFAVAIGYSGLAMMGLQFGLTARFRYVTGNPYTPSHEGAFDATTGTFQAASSVPANGARLPLFHQLDLRVDKTWTFRLIARPSCSEVRVAPSGASSARRESERPISTVTLPGRD